MKILYVNDFYQRGGAEICVQRLANQMKLLGHKAYSASTQRVDCEGHFQINSRKRSILGEKTIYSDLNRSTVRVQMNRIIGAVQPDIVHCNNLMLLSAAPVIAAREWHIPRILTMHDYWLICPRRSLLRADGGICEAKTWDSCFRCVASDHPSRLVKASAFSLSPLGNSVLERRMQRLRALFERETLICPSKFAKDAITRFGFEAGRIHVIPNGIDVKLFKPASDPSTTLLWVGRITRPKGLDFLMRVAELVRRERAGTKFRVVGGEPAGSLYAYDHFPHSNAAEFVGYVPWDELAHYYSECLAVVITSIWPEPSSLVALEAMAAGKPVIGFDVGGLNELVTSRTGLLVRSKDVFSMAERVLDLLHDKELAMKMGKEARRLVETEYSVENMASNYEAVIRRET